MQSELSKLRESTPPPCKVHTEEQFEALSYQGQAAARHRDMKVLHQFLSLAGGRHCHRPVSVGVLRVGVGDQG
eukprot:1712171-Pleurochrysis_carterae.AAC.1